MTDIIKRTGWTTAGIAATMVLLGLVVTSRGKAPTTAAAPPTAVSVIHLQSEDVATYREYPARTYARDLVEVRGRVDGYVDQRTFDIGFRRARRPGALCPRRSAVRSRRSNALEARSPKASRTSRRREATLVKTRQDVERLEPLVQRGSGAKAGPRQRSGRWPGRRSGGHGAPGDRRGQPRTSSHRGAQSGIRDDSRADQRPHRRQPAAGRRARDENVPAAIDRRSRRSIPSGCAFR